MGTREDVKVNVVVNLERSFDCMVPRELSMIIGVYIDRGNNCERALSMS